MKVSIHWNILLVLFGTCAYFGKAGLGYEIGYPALISKATKVDRGLLSSGCVFTMRSDKLAQASATLDGKGILSGNVLYTALSRDLQQLFADLHPDGFIEMEVFDFFSVCNLHNKKALCAIKVVSDLCDGKNNKLCRLTCSFERGVRLFLDLQNFYDIKKYPAVEKTFRQCMSDPASLLFVSTASSLDIDSRRVAMVLNTLRTEHEGLVEHEQKLAQARIDLLQ